MSSFTDTDYLHGKEFEDLQTSSKYFLMTVIGLSFFGVIMVYSSSYIYAKETYGSSIHYFVRQIAFLFISLGVCYTLYKTKINFWLKYAKYINYFAIFILIITLIPGVGLNIKGARRWIEFMGFGLQPAEFAKYSLVLFSVTFFDNFQKMSLKEKIEGVLGILTPLTLILLQPDFGSFTICGAALVFVCFMSDFPRKYFYAICASSFFLSIPLLLYKPYRVKRLFTFLDPWKDPQGSGFQIIQSWLAFANGGFLGQGIGNSNEKLFYLPEAHNDFIFSVVGEELGLVGVLIVIIVHLFFIYQGLKISILVENHTKKILVSSIVFVLGLQSFLNMGVVLGLLPTKGLNLPFISYGGSSLLASFIALGLIFSIVRSEINHA